MIGALYSIPASIFRAYGGVLSDRVGARTVMYWSLGVSAAATLVLSLPPTDLRGARHQGRHRLHWSSASAASSSRPSCSASS